MLAKRIIPCLDIRDGRVVKGVKFVELKDAGDPVECAIAYDRGGADELVFLDITASHEARPIVEDVVRRVAAAISIPFSVGGGLKDLEGIRAILRSGADKVSLNTVAVENPEFVSKAAARFGNQCIIIAIDAKRHGSGWHVYTHGGRKDSGKDALEWAKEVETRGAGEILLTSMDRDGTTDGYDIELTAAVSRTVGIPVIASGGAGSLEHLKQAFLKAGCDAVLAASIFHFGTYTIEQAKEYLSRAGIPVRR
ncbi:MAG: imidazole glycerol phosphate synthase subunit HisF [Candidatus Omnitrophica bacterium]|nr:imidazole glycerol phosphate synthase subunit HisF [Candidatus Omnitrophota bacterium]